MQAPRSVAEALQTLLSQGPAETREAALVTLSDLPTPATAAGLQLLEEWEPGTQLALATRAARERMQAHLAEPGHEVDPAIVAFRDPAAPYRILGPLGSGASGRVFLAVQVTLRRLVALKVLAPAPAEPGGAKPFQRAAEAMSRQRFQRAAQQMGRLLHPNLCTIFDAGGFRSFLFMSLELVDGRNLHQIVASEGPLPWQRAAALVAEVAGGLNAAHQLGLVHRAIKPANVLVDRHGRGKLTDFSLAGPGAMPLSVDDLLTGAASYRSPEEAAGEAPDVRSDLYALGAVLFHALTGGPPFAADSLAAVVDAQRAGPAPELPAATAPEGLVRLVADLLAQDPAKRPASAAVVVEACREALGTVAVAVAPVAGASKPLTPAVKTILVVDDSQLVLRVLHRILSGDGYRVVTAQSPQEALELAQVNTVDVLLTDMVFKEGESGRDLVGALRKLRPGMPVVAMSGQLGKNGRDELLGEGIATFLAKPLEPQEVLDAVGRACVGAGRSLLLVDDDRLIRLVLKRLFENAAFVVRTAASIDEARRLIEEQTPDVIVSDLHIRDESGLKLLQHVRDAGLELPFIMLSGSPDPESVIAAYRLRVFDFVVKSDDMKQLIGAVKGAVAGPA